MEKIKTDIEWKRRALDDLIVLVCAKRKACFDAFQFNEADRLERCVLGLQKAQNELFYAQIAL